MPTNDDALTKRMAGTLPGLLGIEVTELGDGLALGRMIVQPHHLAPNGYLHAASVVALADTLTGFGCFHSRPAGATGFTTIELKSNFFGSAREGTIVCVARPLHQGRTTQVWDATVSAEGSTKPIAQFRNTQLVLWPKG
jgi:1,4-dihydroxy-2-naphthoyl-CoA hydrolase